MFFAMLGTIAANLAVTTGAHGGVYIAGGIVPRLVEQLHKSEFRARFEAKGRYRDYLKAIPTSLITAPLPAFRGLRYLLGYR
jgi:glucokinase